MSRPPQRPRRRSLVLLAAFTILACASGPEPRSIAELESYARDSTQQYIIGPYDQLSISVWQQPALTLGEVVVRLDGKISFPLLDDVQAAGLSVTELKQVISERLSEFIVDPSVTIVVRQINSKEVYVLGEVARVGAVRLRGGMRVVDALATAGGFRPFAEKREVKVIRHMNGSGAVEILFDYKRYESGEDLEQNILLLPGDRIVVPEQSPFWR